MIVETLNRMIEKDPPFIGRTIDGDIAIMTGFSDYGTYSATLLISASDDFEDGRHYENFIDPKDVEPYTEVVALRN